MVCTNCQTQWCTCWFQVAIAIHALVLVLLFLTEIWEFVLLFVAKCIGFHYFLYLAGLFSNHGPLYFVNTKMSFSKQGLACHIAKIHSEVFLVCTGVYFLCLHSLKWTFDNQASVEKNAKEIKEYIEEIYWGSKKRVLLLGHSKGGVDAAAALSLYWPDLKDKVAGLALAQSPYGGSPIATDILREGQLGDYVNLRKLMEILICKVIKVTKIFCRLFSICFLQ